MIACPIYGIASTYPDEDAPRFLMISAFDDEVETSLWSPDLKDWINLQGPPPVIHSMQWNLFVYS